jgi:hypothetical protein
MGYIPAKIGQRRYDQFHATLRAIVDLAADP